MTVSVDLPTPERVLAIGAHPDDIEFGCGATLAKWSAAGAHVTMCVLTDGAKGTWDRAADTAKLVEARTREQRAAAAVLGAQATVLLGFADGELRTDAAGIEALCRVIRDTRPDVVLAHDPWKQYRLHPDHGHAGHLAVAGIVNARDPHFFPEHGNAPHRPCTLLCFEPGRIDHVERVDGFVERKIEALLAHRSQWRSTMGIADDPEREVAAFARGLRDEARADGVRAGVRAAEAFARIDDL